MQIFLEKRTVEGFCRFCLREPEPSGPSGPSGRAAHEQAAHEQAARVKRLELAAERPEQKTIGASGPSDHIKMEACKDLTDNL